VVFDDVNSCKDQGMNWHREGDKKLLSKLLSNVDKLFYAFVFTLKLIHNIMGELFLTLIYNFNL